MIVTARSAVTVSVGRKDFGVIVQRKDVFVTVKRDPRLTIKGLAQTRKHLDYPAVAGPQFPIGVFGNVL